MEMLASIPSPGGSEIHLGPFPLRGYAVCIIIGVFLAIWLGGRRWVDRGGRPGTVADIAVWAVPFGLVGARVYHVVTDYQLYFGEGEEWVDAFKIWDGGIGIWGAIAGGALGAWVACRRRGIALPPMADAVAPGLALAQAAGRWGNWFNQELFGKPTSLPWGLEIDPGRPGTVPDEATYHPTFLYESLWCLGVAALVIWADRRFRLGHGRAFALYVAAYTAGRCWIESMRTDPVNEFLGLRLNIWTSLAVFAAAVTYLVVSARLRPGREEGVEPPAGDDEPGDPDAAADASKDRGSVTLGKSAGEPEGSAAAERQPDDTAETGEKGERDAKAEPRGDAAPRPSPEHEREDDREDRDDRDGKERAGGDGDVAEPAPAAASEPPGDGAEADAPTTPAQRS